jgi:hypothetical protein
MTEPAKPTEEQEIILDCWNQFAYESYDKRGWCWLNNGGLSTLESLASYIHQHNLAKFDKRGRSRAKWRDQHKCPACKNMISVGMWHDKAGMCYDCNRQKERGVSGEIKQTP